MTETTKPTLPKTKEEAEALMERLKLLLSDPERSAVAVAPHDAEWLRQQADRGRAWKTLPPVERLRLLREMQSTPAWGALVGFLHDVMAAALDRAMRSDKPEAREEGRHTYNAYVTLLDWVRRGEVKGERALAEQAENATAPATRRQ